MRPESSTSAGDVDVSLLVVKLDGQAAAHLRRALDDHGRWCRINGRSMPPALVDLSGAVTAGPDRSDRDFVDELPDDAAVILLPFDEVGRRLGVSESTVRRLVRDGQLQAVSVGSARRVHVDDLRAYTSGLREGAGTREAASRG